MPCNIKLASINLLCIRKQVQVRDRAWFVRLYGKIIDRTGAQTMLELTCTTITSVDLAHYGVSRAKDWVSVDWGTRKSLEIHSIKCGSELQLYLSYWDTSVIQKLS